MKKTFKKVFRREKIQASVQPSAARPQDSALTSIEQGVTHSPAAGPSVTSPPAPLSSVATENIQATVSMNMPANIQSLALVNSHVTVMRDQYVSFNVPDPETNVLSILNPAMRGEYYVPRCMDGTRENVFKEIDSWLNEHDSVSATNILWISGSPGSGKSAILSSLVSKLTEQKRLGSSFFFKRGDTVLEDPASFWRTVAFDLSQFHPVIKTAVVQFLNKPGFREGDIQLHFKRMIEDVLKNHCEKLSTLPPVVVVDALDECGSDETHYSQRQILLDTLPLWSRLPRSLKLILTSRDERMPASLYDRNVCHKIMLETGDTVTLDTQNDIRFYLEKRFKVITPVLGLEPTWPGADALGRLVERAAGLFVWAKTAVAFIETRTGNPVEKLKLVLAGNLGKQIDNIDTLYRNILDFHFEESDETTFEMFRHILGAVIVARTSLTRADLHKLLGISEEVTWSFNSILNKLSSVIDLDGPLRLRHLSFAEFLVDAMRCRDPRFLIDPEACQYRFAYRCLEIMGNELQFNICSLPTSYLPNDSNPHDEAAINPHLSYSCRFWTEHLTVTRFDEGIARQIQVFFHTKLLYWLEVLSLIKAMNSASISLLSIVKWSQDDDIASTANDIHRFIRTFAGAMAKSAPHIYLSALPFAPEQSFVSRVYLSKYRRMPHVVHGKLAHWPAIQNVLQGHSEGVNTVAFSPDGKHIVSGSGDYTIRVWDVGTGNLVSGPFEGHTNWVGSIAFSPDGRHIVSGSHDHTIRVWDVETGRVVSGPFKGHSSLVFSVAFSPDGKCIVSGSHDHTIRVWDVKTGRIVSGPFEDHTGWVKSVVFSPDGKHIVSGSDDKTIRVWDVDTGRVVSHPFEGHTHLVNSVAFSPDGKYIVSGSQDGTIKVWDVETGKVVSDLFEGKTSGVSSVAFSPDGKHIASGSDDCTIRVWDMDLGMVMSNLCQCHTEWVNSVAFSPDGKHIASGSYDCTIRVWNMETGRLVSGPFEGHTNWVLSIAFSPDGKYIVSGSGDCTVMVWDVDTRRVISGPFEDHTEQVNTVAFSPDGKCIASGSGDGTIWVWDVETGEVVSGPFEGHTNWVKSIAFSPDGKYIVSGSGDCIIRLWDVDVGVISGVFKGHTGWVNSVAFSPDGKYIVSGSDDCTIRVWDVDTGRVVSNPFEGHTEAVYSAAFSPDIKHIVSGSGDHTIRVWDVDTGGVVSSPLQGHTDSVYSVAFSPDGKSVVSGSIDCVIRVWDVNIDSEGSCATQTQGQRMATIVSPTSFTDTSPMTNGWLIKEPSDLLLWVPPWSRLGLWRPGNIMVIGKYSTKLDLRTFVHGPSWHHCKD